MEDEGSLAVSPLTWTQAERTEGWELVEGQGSENKPGGADIKAESKPEDRASPTDKPEGAQAGHLGVLRVGWKWWGLGWVIRSLRPPQPLRESFRVETRPGWDFVVVSEVHRHFPNGVRPPGFFRLRVFGGSYHVQDYTIFYFNVRENVRTRVAAFLEKRRGDAVAQE